MARFAMAREKIFALRREIARIEGNLPERLAAPGEDGSGETVLRRYGRMTHTVPCASEAGTVGTGASRFDVALGGGLLQAALTEVIGRETRDGGLVSGFALALAAIASRNNQRDGQPGRPVLWISLADMLAEAGFPYAPGVEQFFGVAPEKLFMARVKRLNDALWAAEEAAVLGGFSAVFLELRGNPARLDLTATRRLHHRARESGRPVFLIRHSAEPEPTAAPTRLLVSPGSSSLRQTVAGPLPRTIGPPAFTVTLTKSRTGRNEDFVLEWNPHDLVFQERRPVRDGQSVREISRRREPQDPGGLVPASFVRPDSAAPARSGLASAQGKRRAS